MNEHKLHCSNQNILNFRRLVANCSDDELSKIVTPAVDFANEIFCLLYSLAECQPHQFSSLKLKAQEFIRSLEG